MPSPSSSAIASASDARPPHTATPRPAGCTGLGDLGNQPQHRRVQRIQPRREQRMRAVHGQHVLGKIVAADGKEIRLAQQLAGEQRRRRRLDHRTQLRQFRDAEFDRAIAQQCACSQQVAQVGHHRQQDPATAGLAQAQDRAQLRAQQFRLREAGAQPAQAQRRVLLGGLRQVRDRLVAADVHGADGERGAARAAC
jgi:hypothetical protein